MKKLELFSTSKLEKVNLNKLTGGIRDRGVETDTSDCTEKDFGWGQGAGDTSRDGDFISTC